MTAFQIQIAGHVLRVEALFDSTRDYCRKYLTEEAPEGTIALRREELALEQQRLDEEAAEEGLRRRVFPDPFLERNGLQRKLADFLFDREILMTHGSTVAVDGKAYLFTAKCGTGKSTHTRLWRQLLGDRAVMINDDKPFLKLGQEILACGSPWSGKHGLDTNTAVPLAGICILHRGPENRIRPISPEEARDMLRKQTYCPPNREAQFQTLTERLLAGTALWQMECTKSLEAARTAYDAMTGK